MVCGGLGEWEQTFYPTSLPRGGTSGPVLPLYVRYEPRTTWGLETREGRTRTTQTDGDPEPQVYAFWFPDLKDVENRGGHPVSPESCPPAVFRVSNSYGGRPEITPSGH